MVPFTPRERARHGQLDTAGTDPQGPPERGRSTSPAIQLAGVIGSVGTEHRELQRSLADLGLNAS
jgi:hypothetical protein